MATATFSAYGTATTVINGADVAPTLKNLSSAAQKCGNEIDNTSDKSLYVDFELYVKGASAFSTGGYVSLYLIPAVDGTNYADGADDSVAPTPTMLVASFPLRAVNTQQRIAALRIPLGPGKYKPVVINNGGQAFTNTDNENYLRYRKYSEAIA